MRILLTSMFMCGSAFMAAGSDYGVWWALFGFSLFAMGRFTVCR